MPGQYGSLTAYKNRIEGGSFFPMITLSSEVLLLYMVFIPSQYDIKGSATSVESSIGLKSKHLETITLAKRLNPSHQILASDANNICYLKIAGYIRTNHLFTTFREGLPIDNPARYNCDSMGWF